MGAQRHLWYVAGADRSGSTLAGDLIAQATGAFNAGELHLLWRSAASDRSCTCGSPITACEVWADVISRAQRASDVASLAEAARIEQDRPRQRQCLIRGWNVSVSARTVELRRATEDAIHHVTGKPELVDISKLAGVAILALRIDRSADVIHLVRDPRAVCYSLSQRKTDPSDHGRAMPQSSTARAAATWLAHNLAVEKLRRERPHSINARIRYEDLAARPHLELRRIGVELPLEANPTGGEHSIAGNPWRFNPRTDIVVDDRWRTQMSASRRMLVSAMTRPLGKSYGY